MMEKVWVYIERILKQCVVSLVVAAIGLELYGQGELVVGIFVGEIIGMACVFITGYRIWRSAEFDASAAVRNMQIGLVIRMFLLLACLAAVIQISVPLFWVVVAGYFLSEFIIVANVVYEMLKKS